MRRHGFLILAVGCLLGADEAPGGAKEELKQLQGTWAVTSLEREGTPETTASVRRQRMTFMGNRFSYTGGKEDYHGTFRIDPSKKPKTMDTTAKQGEKTITTRGIYELDGDTLKVCWSEDEQRPTSFASKDLAGVRSIILKREGR